MANAPKIDYEAANTACNAITGMLNSGKFKIYTGSGPADCDTVSNGTLLVTCDMNPTAFQSAVNGVAAANAIGQGTCVAAGTAGYFRIFDSGNTDPGDVHIQGSVGTTGCDLNMDSVDFQINGTVDITGFSVTVSRS